MPYHRLSTLKIARAVGCHPNTVRLYEQIGFIAPVARSPKGYRLFTEAHLDQMRLARMAMDGPWLGPNIRRVLVNLAKTAASEDYQAALEMAYQHLSVVRLELEYAETAVAYLESWANGSPPADHAAPLLISQTAQLLGVTVDMLYNWERSGLLTVPRSSNNRYRQYGAAEIGRVRVIRLLRQAGYSPMAILRMLVQLDQGSPVDLRSALDTPRPDEDIIVAADRWLSALNEQVQRAHRLIDLTKDMLRKYGLGASLVQPEPTEK